MTREEEGINQKEKSRQKKEYKAKRVALKRKKR